MVHWILKSLNHSFLAFSWALNHSTSSVLIEYVHLSLMSSVDPPMQWTCQTIIFSKNMVHRGYQKKRIFKICAIEAKSQPFVSVHSKLHFQIIQEKCAKYVVEVGKVPFLHILVQTGHVRHFWNQNQNLNLMSTRKMKNFQNFENLVSKVGKIDNFLKKFCNQIFLHSMQWPFTRLKK